MFAINNFSSTSGGGILSGGSRIGKMRFGDASIPIYFLALITLLSSGCATTYKGKIAELAAGGAALGILAGQVQDKNQTGYSIYYGAASALIAGAIATFYYDPDQKLNQYQQETQSLKKKLDEFQKPTQIDQGKGLYTAKLPSDVSKFIQPGEWKRYKMDQWVQDPNSPNIWYRQVEMFEVIPPITQ